LFNQRVILRKSALISDEEKSKPFFITFFIAESQIPPKTSFTALQFILNSNISFLCSIPIFATI